MLLQLLRKNWMLKFQKYKGIYSMRSNSNNVTVKDLISLFKNFKSDSILVIHGTKATGSINTKYIGTYHNYMNFWKKENSKLATEIEKSKVEEFNFVDGQLEIFTDFGTDY